MMMGAPDTGDTLPVPLVVLDVELFALLPHPASTSVAAATHPSNAYIVPPV